MDNNFCELLEFNNSYPDEIETNRLTLERHDSFRQFSSDFFIFLKESHAEIGKVTILSDGEICYEIYERFHNNGYATEAVAKLIEISNRNFFYLLIKPHNYASAKVARKLGFNLKTENSICLVFEFEKEK